MTFGSRTTSAGLPSTSTLPRSSTMARSTSGITISMTCSTISTVMPRSRTRRTSSTPVWASTGVSPVRTSSSSSSFGSVASARATSSRRFSDGTRSLASTSARASRPQNSSTSCALRLAPCIWVFRTSAPTMTLSTTLMVSKLFTTWKVRPTPRWQRSAAGRRVTSSPSNQIEPWVGGNAPAIRLNRVDLPAPLGPIRPTISPRPTEIETSLLATRPEKRCVTPRVSSSAVMPGSPCGGARTIRPGLAAAPAKSGRSACHRRSGRRRGRSRR